ncbi:hypothetical protein KA695_002610 [Listeria monocytogenes]|nr:hypothetical protein [Listeria monocytogenes]EEQ0060957.1 hypothetical protein [Listeria monocytogenes]EEQ0087528.1 hypothetical protein [Listeria monocytogenes]EGF3715776.1 hypothetical protein [Listeria monocytogenes]EGF3720965.1 hypothetical protein [Listeria monocytogenes]
MEENKEQVISKIIGTLIKSELNAHEVIELLGDVQDIYLKRSWHISINKKAD